MIDNLIMYIVCFDSALSLSKFLLILCYHYISSQFLPLSPWISLELPWYRYSCMAIGPSVYVRAAQDKPNKIPVWGQQRSWWCQWRQWW